MLHMYLQTNMAAAVAMPYAGCFIVPLLLWFPLFHIKATLDRHHLNHCQS